MAFLDLQDVYKYTTIHTTSPESAFLDQSQLVHLPNIFRGYISSDIYRKRMMTHGLLHYSSAPGVCIRRPQSPALSCEYNIMQSIIRNVFSEMEVRLG